MEMTASTATTTITTTATTEQRLEYLARYGGQDKHLRQSLTATLLEDISQDNESVRKALAHWGQMNGTC